MITAQSGLKGGVAGFPFAVTSEKPRDRSEIDALAVVVDDRPSLDERAESKLRPTSLFHSCRELRAALRGADYLIEGYAERDSFAIMFGDSDTYKSLIAFDIGMHVATGRDWYGHRVKQGPVIIIAGEGHSGVGRRLSAWMITHGVTDDPPVYVPERAFALNDKDEAIRVADEILRLSEEIGAKPAMIIIDTLARNMDGDENSSQDVGRFIAEVTRYLGHGFGAFVLVIHHVGHGDKERERGSYALRGAADARYVVKRDGDLSATIETLKIKDGPLPDPLRIKLQVVDLGITDNFGNPQSSLAVTSVSTAAVAPRKTGGKIAKALSPDRRAVLTAIQSVVSRSGRLVQQEGVPANLRVTDISALRDEFARTFEGGAIPSDEVEAKRLHDRRRKAFERAMTALRNDDLIDFRDGFVWSNASEGRSR